MKEFYLSDTIHKWHILFDLPGVAWILANWETATTLSIAPELNTLYIVEIKKILGIAGFKPILVFY